MFCYTFRIEEIMGDKIVENMKGDSGLNRIEKTAVLDKIAYLEHAFKYGEKLDEKDVRWLLEFLRIISEIVNEKYNFKFDQSLLDAANRVKNDIPKILTYGLATIHSCFKDMLDNKEFECYCDEAKDKLSSEFKRMLSGSLEKDLIEQMVDWLSILDTDVDTDC